jgi:uncharacterized protein DUF4229
VLAVKKARPNAPDDLPESSVDIPVNPHPVLRYTTLRLAIFAVALVLLWLVRVRGLLLVALAVLISGLASYALLQRERDAVSARVAAAASQRKSRSAARAAREDGVAEELAESEAANVSDAPDVPDAPQLPAEPRS